MMEKIQNFYKRVLWPNFFEIPLLFLLFIISYSLKLKKSKVCIIDSCINDFFLDFIIYIFPKIYRCIIPFPEYQKLMDINLNDKHELFKKFNSFLDSKNFELIVISPNLSIVFHEFLNDPKTYLIKNQIICYWDRSIDTFMENFYNKLHFKIIYKKYTHGLYPTNSIIIKVV